MISQGSEVGRAPAHRCGDLGLNLYLGEKFLFKFTTRTYQTVSSENTDFREIYDIPRYLNLESSALSYERERQANA